MVIILQKYSFFISEPVCWWLKRFLIFTLDEPSGYIHLFLYNFLKFLLNLTVNLVLSFPFKHKKSSINHVTTWGWWLNPFAYSEMSMTKSKLRRINFCRILNASHISSFSSLVTLPVSNDPFYILDPFWCLRGSLCRLLE